MTHQIFLKFISHSLVILRIFLILLLLLLLLSFLFFSLSGSIIRKRLICSTDKQFTTERVDLLTNSTHFQILIRNLHTCK